MQQDSNHLGNDITSQITGILQSYAGNVKVRHCKLQVNKTVQFADTSALLVKIQVLLNITQCQLEINYMFQRTLLPPSSGCPQVQNFLNYPNDGGSKLLQNVSSYSTVSIV
jgi:hypothetical protein